MFFIAVVNGYIIYKKVTEKIKPRAVYKTVIALQMSAG